MKYENEKVYITRDEVVDKNSLDHIWVWLKPKKGNWSPNKMKDCGMVVYQREDIEQANHYLVPDFKKKFGISINTKTKKCVHLPYDLLHNEDYKLISNDPNRKQ